MSMESLFSRRQNTRGGGRPDALHDNVAFSPSRTETSPSEVPEFKISGGTERNETTNIRRGVMTNDKNYPEPIAPRRTVTSNCMIPGKYGKKKKEKKALSGVHGIQPG